MAKTSEGMNYAPKGKPNPVVKKGAFAFAAIALDHGHIYGMSNGLCEAGADLKWVYDPDPKKVKAFLEKFPQAKRPVAKKKSLMIRKLNLSPGRQLLPSAALSDCGP